MEEEKQQTNIVKADGSPEYPTVYKHPIYS
jgi:hypothetical protein